MRWCSQGRGNRSHSRSGRRPPCNGSCRMSTPRGRRRGQLAAAEAAEHTARACDRVATRIARPPCLGRNGELDRVGRGKGDERQSIVRLELETQRVVEVGAGRVEDQVRVARRCARVHAGLERDLAGHTADEIVARVLRHARGAHSAAAAEGDVEGGVHVLRHGTERRLLLRHVAAARVAARGQGCGARRG
ncbi:hypothetical protein T492DRAFT_990064 [Pavlovales sp. CCMP2436]|nr:hypothetical protein T492DRAFT_990064 [Pavlovales sp. CCMP2436]